MFGCHDIDITNKPEKYVYAKIRKSDCWNYCYTSSFNNTESLQKACISMKLNIFEDALGWTKKSWLKI